MNEASKRGRAAQKIGRHIHWARTQGVRRLIEEDQLNPVTRARTTWTKWRWRRVHGGQPGEAVPVWLVGLQRSGTNMLVRGLETAPEFEVHNENDRRAFDGFMLRSDPQVANIVRDSRHRLVLFKPLCDSHRVVHLLENLPGVPQGRAIWAYRSVDGRVRSTLAKFGDHNLQVLRDFASGRGTDRWHVQGMSDENREFVTSFDYSTMSPASAAALFWFVRNSLYFDLSLDARSDTFLASYDLMIDDSERMMRALCDFLRFPYAPALVAHVDGRATNAKARIEMDPRIRVRCDELTDRLDAVIQGRVRIRASME